MYRIYLQVNKKTNNKEVLVQRKVKYIFNIVLYDERKHSSYLLLEASRDRLMRYIPLRR